MSGIRQIPLTCSGHTRPVVHLDFSDMTSLGTSKMISACKDGKPMLRRGDTGDWIGTFEGHKGAVWGVALNTDGTLAASGAADFTAKVWSGITGDLLNTFQHSHIVKSVDFSPDAGRLATASNEKLIRIFDLQNTTSDPQVFSGHTGSIRHVKFFKGDTHLVSCADDKTLRVWSCNTGKEVMKLDFPCIPNSLELSKDKSVLTVAYATQVAFYDTNTMEKIRQFSLGCQVNSASLHHSKSFFVTGGDDFKVYKFDYTTGNEIESYKGHFGSVHCVRFSADGEIYASGSEDGTLRLWQTIVGKTYGLWKCVDGPSNMGDSALSPREVPAN